MSTPLNLPTLLESIADHLDIPKGHYERAAARHKTLGEWLCRSASGIRNLEPYVSPQGSFRIGTVIKPLHESSYDLDNVAVFKLPKDSMTQRQLKSAYGREVSAYAAAYGISSPVEEKNRCWRLLYQDDAAFHLDTLPALQEDSATISNLVLRGVPQPLAAVAVAITDRRHPDYDHQTRSWLSSNPRGFARWFEQRTRASAEARSRALVSMGLYATVENVPPYQWKSPLQRSIQLMKRHRDVMFDDRPDEAPISMVITNLAAKAYSDEPDLAGALLAIVDRMPKFVDQEGPRVPNPTDPLEDYADSWRANPVLEPNFWIWHAQLKADLGHLFSVSAHSTLTGVIKRIFRVTLSEDELLRALPASPASPAIISRTSPALVIPAAPRPWGNEH